MALQWPLTPQGFTGPMQQVVLELKIQHKGKAAMLAWEAKIYREAHRVGPRDISVSGM